MATVFIIAPHRSGTTILYSLLAASGCFNVVTAFHVLNRHRLLDLHQRGELEEARRRLQRELASAGVTDEYGEPVTADHPEEYSYALARQGRRPTLDQENLASFREFCRAAQAVQDPARSLLLKNPFDTRNFLFIRDAVPDARFVLLHRHPAEIIDSQLRLIRWMLHTRSSYDALIVERYRRLYDRRVRLAAARAVCSPRLPLLFEMVFRNIVGGCDYAVAHADALGAQAISITYPDLCRDPAAVVKRVLDFAGVAANGHAAEAPVVGRRTGLLTPEVERRLPRIERRTDAYRRRFGLPGVTSPRAYGES
jgi:LPS sulfotransferase NodH